MRRRARPHRPHDTPHFLSVDIPQDWSAQHALAFYEWLEALRTRIWLLYGTEIQRFLRSDIGVESHHPLIDDDEPF